MSDSASRPNTYLRVIRPDAPLFTSLEAAVAGEPVYRTLETGFDYVTYIDYAEVDGVRYYMIAPGIWMQKSKFKTTTE